MDKPEWEYAGHQSCRVEIERLRYEVHRLKETLRDVIFDLHNCEYGGDMPHCEHITDALKIARATKPYDEPRAP